MPRNLLRLVSSDRHLKDMSMNAPEEGQKESPKGESFPLLISGMGRDPDEDLSPERIAEVRKRILDGTYDSLEVLDQVARRILSRGEL
jgi:hypothetical protein